MDLLNVVIRADTGGSDRATQSLDKMTASARLADHAVKAVGSASSAASGTLGQAASSTDRATASSRAHAASVQAQVTANNGLIASYRGSSLAADQAAQAAARASAANNNAAGRTNSFSTANIAAQFQDIGVTAAMGMNPLQIALQQGTQLSAVFATMERPLQGIAAGLASIISPVALITIGLVALAAAGLQFVNWGSVAETMLNVLADGLELIAPYAAAAAVGLALLYSPAILAGLMAAVGSLGTVAKALWGVAAAIYATVGLPVLLIAGFAAMATAAVIWRDDLEKMLGVDIVGAAQTGVNFIIGAFVGGFKGIQLLWVTLPNVLGDITIQAAQAVLNGVTTMLNESRTQVLSFLSWVSSLPLPGVNSLALAGVGALAGEGELTAPQIPNPNKGTAAAVTSYAADTMRDAMATDYLGTATTFVQNAASGAADAMRSLADGIGVNTKASKAAAKEAERQAEAYRDLTRSAHQFIAEQQLEAQTLGITEEAANRLRYEQDLLSKAANDNIKLSAEQRTELSALAEQMAAAEEATRRLTDIYDSGKQIFSSFFGDLKSGIESGKGLWQSLGDAAVNALSSIANKALEMATSGIWDMIFGAIMGGFGGGMMPGGSWNIPTNFVPGGFYPGFANGTNSAPGGLAWVGERGPELVNLPRGAQVFPNQQSMAMAANQNQASSNGGSMTVRLIMPDGWKAEVVGEARAGARQDTVQIVQENQRARDSFYAAGGNPR